jgi:hypothetical protein
LSFIPVNLIETMESATTDKAKAYKERQRSWRVKHDAAGRDALNEIGEIPPVLDPELRESWRYDLVKFLVEAFPESTGLSPLSEDHERATERIQICSTKGGRVCNAVFRGWAKTTISENAALHAALFGHRKFISIIGADKTAADEIIDSIKSELEHNDILFEQFPEVCYPIRKLAGKPQRCKGQTHGGKRTCIEWTANEVAIPMVAGSAASGCRIVATGLTGRIRGMKFKRQDGTQQRPDFVIIDDFQTEESARSQHQTKIRLDIIRKAVLKLAGHNKTIACVLNATVMQPDDGVEQIIADTSWMSERVPMVKQFAAAHDTFWLKTYKDMRTNYDPDDPQSQETAKRNATQLYIENREMADAGCVVSWDHCYDDECEVSAIQHAYNFLIDDGQEVFDSECQQQPAKDAVSLLMMTSSEIGRKTLKLERRISPIAADKITAFIDVQKNSLWWSLVAFGGDFSGHVIDYGVWPDQWSEYYALKTLKKTFATEYAGRTLDAQIYQALEDCTFHLLGKKYTRDDGAELAVSRCLIDAGWGESTDTVYKFCRNSMHTVTPAHGKSIRATHAPMRDWKSLKERERGHHWIHRLGGGREVRHVLVDTNYWKSFLHRRLQAPIGDPGCFTLWDEKASRHKHFTDQLVSEVPKEAKHGSRTVDEWVLKPDRPDNHWFDCLVGCCVAASMEGITLPEWEARKIVKRKRRTRKASRL